MPLCEHVDSKFLESSWSCKELCMHTALCCLIKLLDVNSTIFHKIKKGEKVVVVY